MSTRLTVPPGKRDHAVGPAAAPVTLVEYGDFECPHCGAAHHVVKEIQKRLGHQLRFVFRHSPLGMAHPHAEHAAEAAEAAGVQGKFWPMHDALFENQEALEDSDLVQYAAALGLDADQFVTELASHVHAPRVREDFMSGVRSGVNGTPSFFVNGIRHDGDYELDSLLASIAQALEAVEAQG
jgi:protein-disulfide isomerase